MRIHGYCGKPRKPEPVSNDLGSDVCKNTHHSIQNRFEDGFLNLMRVDKGVMTLVDEEEQHRLLAHLDAFEGTRGSGGSAANTLIAVSAMGGSSYYACKVADDEHFRMLVQQAVTFQPGEFSG